MEQGSSSGFFGSVLPNLDVTNFGSSFKESICGKLVSLKNTGNDGSYNEQFKSPRNSVTNIVFSMKNFMGNKLALVGIGGYEKDAKEERFDACWLLNYSI